MRSVLYITTVPASLRFVDGQVAFQQARGWHVHVLSSGGPELQSYGLRRSVQIHTADLTRSITPVRDLRALFRAAGLIRRLRPTIVHAHTPKGSLIGMLAATLAGHSLRIYHVHGLPLETAHGLRRIALRWSERVTCALAHAVVCQSDSLRSALLAHRLCAPHKCGVLAGVGTGVDAENHFNPERIAPAVREAILAEQGIPADGLIVGYVGRLTRDKGIAELADMWRTILTLHPAAHLLVVGGLDAREPGDAAITAALRALPQVHYAGRVNDPAPYYATMDVLVLPSYREGISYVALEAAAMGIPVVATRTTGCVDAVSDGETGQLVEPRSAAALTGALDRYLQDAALRAQHGAAGRARMLREFRQPPIWEACNALYNSLLETRRARLLSAAAKRCFDVMGSVVLLFLCAPLFALVALVIRVTMGSPVVFRQLRPGLLGRPFTLHKFRTMRLCRRAEDEMLPGADRITALGRWLRDSSLDELPQLWDVLRGRMSLVGPRPLLLEYLPRYTKEQARRHLVKPGITGWAQVNGRNGITWEERFALDVWYVEHASLWLDVRVLFRTVGTVLTRDRVSPPNRVLMEQFNGS